MENKEIKVTKCSECPMFYTYESSYDSDIGEIPMSYYRCEKMAFNMIHNSPKDIHPNCPLKGKTITYKIGENE